MGVGIFIWLYAGYIEGRTDTSFIAFKWLAALFVAWGAYRLSRRHFSKKQRKEPAGPPPKKQAHDYHHGSAHQTHGHVRSRPETHAHAKPHPHTTHNPHHAKRCPHCHETVHQQDIQCPHCHRAV